MRFIIYIILTSFLLFSCEKSIWEDRIVCPCILTLDLSNVSDDKVEQLHLWVFGEDDKIIHRDTINRVSFGKDYQLLVSREMVNYQIWGNIKNATSLRDDLTFNTLLSKVENISSDSLYHSGNIINTVVEEIRDTVILCKEFITFDINFKGYVEKVLNAEVSLNANGYYVDRKIVSGVGKIALNPVSNTEEHVTNFNFRITRQQSLDEINLQLFTKINNIPVLLYTYKIGKMLKDNGYDMQAKHLSDIKIEVDHSNNFITITTDNWKVTTPIDIDF